MKRTLDSKHRDTMTTMALQNQTKAEYNDEFISLVVSFLHITLDGSNRKAKENQDGNKHRFAQQSSSRRCPRGDEFIYAG